MHNYSSKAVQSLYQEEPAYYKKSAHKLKGWTETGLGYCNEAESCAIPSEEHGSDESPLFLGGIHQRRGCSAAC